MTRIHQNSIFYHIYPLGALGAPHRNDFSSQPVPRLREMLNWLDHIQALGVNAIYLGPMFESSSHGYDTANYYEIDRRLGTREDLRAFANELKARGMRLVLDGVFNHVGRDFWAFRDVLENRERSAWRDWFAGMRFDQRSPMGDPFSYEAWNGHFDLVKLNLSNPAVKEHLFGAIAMWKEEFDIDGIRLDAADSLSFDFMRELRAYCNQLDSGLWLMGEVIHGDYRRWANPESLHATTNYELYKSMWSALNDGNFFELAHSLKRQFGPGGLYQDLKTQYNFVDNHDVTRIINRLKLREHLPLIQLLMFTLPGLPSVYYGSEFGFEGVKQSDDWNLRPVFDLQALEAHYGEWANNLAIALKPSDKNRDLRALLHLLSRLRLANVALTRGDYRELMVKPEQFAFTREHEGQIAIVAVNSAADSVDVELTLPRHKGWRFVDLLDESQSFIVDEQGKLKLNIPAYWGKILTNQN